MSARKLAPVHPGEILIEEFMRPLGLSQNRLARDLKVTPYRINQIVNFRRRITADTALRLAHYFETTPELWMNLQAHYDLEQARDSLEAKIDREVGRAPGLASGLPG